MHAEFWQARWALNEIGFHQSEVNPYLQQHWPTLGLPQGSRVLVPLCGKSLDMAWLAGQGYRVVGVELVQRAVEEFFSEHQLEPEISQEDGFQVYRARGGVTIYCGDVFTLDRRQVADCAALYDRAALIALPLSKRARYATHFGQILPRSTQALLVTLDYEQAQMDGPPFAVTDEEVQRLFASHWDVQRLQQQDVLGENARFLQRGLTRLEERVYRLVHR